MWVWGGAVGQMGSAWLVVFNACWIGLSTAARNGRRDSGRRNADMGVPLFVWAREEFSGDPFLFFVLFFVLSPLFV